MSIGKLTSFTFVCVLTLPFAVLPENQAHSYQAESQHDPKHDHQADIERNAKTDKQLFAAAKGTQTKRHTNSNQIMESNLAFSRPAPCTSIAPA